VRKSFHTPARGGRCAPQWAAWSRQSMYTQVTVAAVGVWSSSELVSQERNRNDRQFLFFYPPFRSCFYYIFFSSLCCFPCCYLITFTEKWLSLSVGWKKIKNKETTRKADDLALSQSDNDGTHQAGRGGVVGDGGIVTTFATRAGTMGIPFSLFSLTLWWRVIRECYLTTALYCSTVCALQRETRIFTQGRKEEECSEITCRIRRLSLMARWFLLLNKNLWRIELFG